MSITKYNGTIPHTQWIDLKNNGVLIECAVLKEDGFGNVYYLEIPSLDGIDKNRLTRIISTPRSADIPLWETMGNSMLKNGMNALEYFHQLVKIITPEGVIMNPRVGAIGTGKVDTVVPAQLGDETAPNSNADERTPAQKRADTIAARKAEADAKATGVAPTG